MLLNDRLSFTVMEKLGAISMQQIIILYLLLTGCVSECTGLATADYQSCNSCNMYVTCLGNFMWEDRQCPDKSVWDDDIKMCSLTSPTCPDSKYIAQK